MLRRLLALALCVGTLLAPLTRADAGVGFQFGQTNDILKAALNAALEDLVRDGTWKTLESKWINATDTRFDCNFASVGEPKNYAYPEKITGEDPDDVLGTWYFTTSRRALRLGSMFNTPPLMSGNPSNPVGFENDIAQALADRLTQEYLTAEEIAEGGPIEAQWHNITKHSSFFGDLAFALNSEAPLVDVLLASLAKTPERQAKVDFSCAYYSQPLGLLRGPLDNDTLYFDSEEDLNREGVKIAVGFGTTNAEWANATYPLATLIVTNGMPDRITDLREGRAHVAVGDYALLVHAAGSPECPDCVLLPFIVGNHTYLSMALRKNGELVETNSTCTDGRQNGDEEGIDCGGSCPLGCAFDDPTCVDKVQNGDEQGVDCGGSCLFPCGSGERPEHVCAIIDKVPGTYDHYFKLCGDSCAECHLGSQTCSHALGSAQLGECCDNYYCCNAKFKICFDEQTGTSYRCGTHCLKSTVNRACDVQRTSYFNPTLTLQLYRPDTNDLDPETETLFRYGITRSEIEADRFLSKFKSWPSGPLYPCQYDSAAPGGSQLSVRIPSAAFGLSPSPLVLASLALAALLAALLRPF